VLMMANMCGDVFQFLMLLCVLLLGFAAALSLIFRDLGADYIDEANNFDAAADAAADAIGGSGVVGGARMLFARQLKRSSDGSGGLSSASASDECVELTSKFATFDKAMYFLFELSLTADLTSAFACMSTARSPNTALVLMFIYAIAVALLLLNMIIAMMGKTFDHHWEHAQELAALQFARAVQDWEDQKEMPAPFNILSLSSYFCTSLYQKATRAVCGRCSGGDAAALAYERQYEATEAPKPTFSVFDTATYIKKGSGNATRKSSITPVSTVIGKADKEARRVQQLIALKEEISTQLTDRFGEQESTASLVDKAVSTMDAANDERMASLEQRLIEMQAMLQQALPPAQALPPNQLSA